MENVCTEPRYYQKDIDNAFDMGLETAISVLENTIGLSSAAQQLILNKLRKDRIKIRDIIDLGKKKLEESYRD